MSDLRKDPVVGRWVIIATERARRPGTFVNPHQHIKDESPQESECPFCHNQDPEIYRVPDGDEWKVLVVPNMTPVVQHHDKFMRRGYGPYDVINAYGAHEVVIESPHHIANMADFDVPQITAVIRTYADRFVVLKKDQHLRYAVVYKNYGWAAGSRKIGHSRSQIMAMAVTPLRVKEKLQGARKYYEYRERCIYCDLIRQELEEDTRVVKETEHFVCLTPFAPRFPFELLIFPKEHNCHFTSGINGKEEDLAYMLKDILMRFKEGLDDPAYNIVLQTAPFRRSRRGAKWATLAEDYHWHLEIMPRLARPAGFEKGSGFYICPIPPEDTAEYLKTAEISWVS